MRGTPAAASRFDELGAHAGRERDGLVLEPVARPDVADRVARAPSSSLIRRHPLAARRAPTSVEAEQAAVDLLVVAALLPRARPAHLARRVRELRDDPRPDVRPELGIDVLDQHLARLVLRVLEDLGDRVDRPADDAGLVEDAVDLAGVVLRRPLGDDALDLLLVLAAREVRREARVVGELGRAPSPRTAGGRRCPGSRRSPPTGRRAT